MAVALIATIALAFARHIEPFGVGLLVGAMVIGAAIGLWRAKVVEMTGMPRLIALLHSFVGLAAVLVGWNGYLHVEGDAAGAEALQLGTEGMLGIHSAEVVIGVFIGAVTFTGSIVANLKLSARIKSAPMMLPGKNFLNVGALVVFAAGTVWFVIDPQLWLLVVVTVLACCSAGTWSPRSAAATCRWWCRCSTAIPAGPRQHRLPARQRPADHHRRAGRVLGCLPVLHYVQGDEPVVHLPGHHQGLGIEAGPARTRTTASTARSTPTVPPICSPRPTR